MKNKLHRNEIMLSQDEITNLDLYELTLLSSIKHIIISNYNSPDAKEIKLNDVLSVLNNGKELPRNNLRRDLSRSFRSLMSKDIFKVVNKIGKRYYIERESILINSNKLYVSIKKDEFINIFSTNLTSNLVKMYGYYIKLLSTLNINSRVGYHSLDTLSEKFGISKGTLVTYNSELEKRNLISIHRRKTFDELTGKFKSFNNVYIKPCDKEHICNWFKIDLEQTNK